mmetsp:Transcript_74772/g.124699  ORF Transcript_74772/g.124699 Transcript_74772/m.124699 type:complete len:251 (-) Transcript_74772:180-932(-)
MTLMSRLMDKTSPSCAKQCCGVCIVCRKGRIAQRANVEQPHLHAFELQPSNVLLLQQIVNLSASPIDVHDVAISNESGVLYTQDNGAAAGYESVGASRKPSRGSIPRPSLSLDDFLSPVGCRTGHQGQQAGCLPLASGQHVQIVSIDTEGWDALVLHGMQRSLASHRVEFIEFEYSRAWKRVAGEISMQQTLEWLHYLGYVCFWHGNRGQLAEANGECWLPDFHKRISHRWSNLVCSYRADLVDEMRKLQ